MPATEQTWWNLKILHVVFAVAALVLLAATVMMLVADHDRPWKEYARGFRELETWSAEARVAQQDLADYRSQRSELEAGLAEARRAPLDPALADRFVALAAGQKEDEQAAGFLAQDIASLVELRGQVDSLGDDAAAKDELARLSDRRFALRGDLLERMRDVAKRARFREDLLAGALKLRKAELDKNRADYELAVAEEAASERQAELLGIADAKREEVAQATLVFQETNTYRKNLDSLIGQITAAEDMAAKLVADHRTKLSLLEKNARGSAGQCRQGSARVAGARRLQRTTACGTGLAAPVNAQQQLP